VALRITDNEVQVWFVDVYLIERDLSRVGVGDTIDHSRRSDGHCHRTILIGDFQTIVRPGFTDGVGDVCDAVVHVVTRGKAPERTRLIARLEGHLDTFEPQWITVLIEELCLNIPVSKVGVPGLVRPLP